MRGVCFYFIQPGVLPLTPSFDFRAFKQCQEVTALGNQVFGDVGLPIHQHEPLKLGQESDGSSLVAVEHFGRVSFQSPMFGVFFFIII